MKTRNLIPLFLGLVWLAAASACKPQPTSASPTPAGPAASLAAAPSAAPAPADPAAAAAPAAKVARIVFVGKEDACDCTRRAIDNGWAALEKALGKATKIPVEKLTSDREESLVEPYRAKKPFMALPAIYFLDGAGGVYELLQGEVTEAQVSAVLQG